MALWRKLICSMLNREVRVRGSHGSENDAAQSQRNGNTEDSGAGGD